MAAGAAREAIRGRDRPDHGSRSEVQSSEPVHRDRVHEGAQPKSRARPSPDFIALARRVLDRVEGGGVTGEFESDDGRQFAIPITPFDVKIWLTNAMYEQAEDRKNA